MNIPAPAPAPRALIRCVHLLFAGLLALTAGHAVLADDPDTAAITALCVLLGAGYAARPLLPAVGRSAPATGVWLGAVGVLWAALLASTADGVWLAFPLFFLQLHLLSPRAGVVAVGATAGTAIVAFTLHQGFFSAASAVGPALGAAVAVAVVHGYRALYRESEARRRLIEELTETRADLAAAQHTAGVLAERERLAREIHDTLAQGLSSIHLLLRAAERALPPRADTAARHVEQARRAAVDNLAEVRRFVADLAPPALEGTTLADALERLCDTVADRHALRVRLTTTGEPTPLPTAYEVALLRVAQSALSNTARHARARHVEVTLDRADDAVVLDVVDDGTGFDPAGLPADLPDPAAGGFGLAAMRARLRELGGTLTIESAPGEGTALSARLPLAPVSGSRETDGARS
ncbi:sensor histidine kinase [Streptomyces megasporus]|uniref:sensor histidine kinase n=1 Tax=Streptomyces megasporus TaxID=44060 RepID=UPI0004E1922C|nr:sensor histidine kinase [Streptomyces megasporus]